MEQRGASGDGPLAVTMIVSEAVPFAKTGGLADVAGALPMALGRLGHRVTVTLPRYREAAGAGDRLDRREIVLDGQRYEVTRFETHVDPQVRVVLVDCPELYDRDGLYGADGRDHPDNAVRFAVLARAGLDEAADGARPAILHAHDWQAGLAPVYARTERLNPVLAPMPTVFTIHNLAYQGLFPRETLATIGLNEDRIGPESLAHRGRVSFLKGGVVFSDVVTTVSPEYAREIVTPEFGRGLDATLAARGSDLVGILNGIDTDSWNPEADPHLPAAFSATDLAGKRAAKRLVLARYGLPNDEEALARPLVGMVTRLVPQKGLDLVEEIAQDLPRLDASFLLLGTGVPQYEALWRGLAASHPTRIGARIGFDESLAHLIEGGADLFLMPSRFEPCGLNQMYSLRYGTVPVVRATGGLCDTVEPYDARAGTGTGFRFTECTGRALLETLREALRVFQDRAAWRRLQAAGMREDHSWDVSAREYVKVYRRAIRGAAGRTADPTGPGHRCG